MFQQNMAVD